MAKRIPNRKGLAVILAIALSTVILGAAGSGLVVPADDSLTPSEYSRLGVPDIGVPWSGKEYAEAAAVLAGLDRTELPRYGSPKSGQIFDRLIASQGSFIESIWTSAHLGEDTFERSAELPSAPRIYAWNHGDRFLFDRELLEIHAAILEYRVEELESLAEQDSNLTQLAEEGQTETEQRRVAKLQESRQQLRDDLGRITVYSLATLIQLAEMDATRIVTRRALRDYFDDLVPRASAHLSPERVKAVAQAMRKLAALEQNAAIQGDLIALANSLPANSP
jgi:hypothetical protein